MTNKRIRTLLNEIYGQQSGRQINKKLESAITSYSRLNPIVIRKTIDQEDVILITYPDQIAESGQQPLQSLNDFCKRYFKGYISALHLLPFFPWSSDDGFSVKDFWSVDQSYGDWDTIRRMCATFNIMIDAVINHISAESDWFLGYLKNENEYKDFFISVEGRPDLSNVVRPRALPLLTEVVTSTGKKSVWTTFSSDQVDLNFKNPDVLLRVLEVLLFYIEQGAIFIRLDAIAYIWKEIGTTCIHLPQTHQIIQLIRAVLDEIAPHVKLITETNVPHEDNIAYFGDGTNEAHLVYNFSLPPLVLHALLNGTAEYLSEWAKSIRLPSDNVTFLNFLASHDGIGINPARGILSKKEIDNLVNKVKSHNGLVSYKNNPDGSRTPYELNINYFDALNKTDLDEPLGRQVDRFISAHAILMSLRGVPGIYIHSMIGSRNWLEGVKQTGRNRTINRQKFELKQLEQELSDRSSLRYLIYNRMTQLLSIRRQQPAFNPYGEQHVVECNKSVFAFKRISPSRNHQLFCLNNVTGEPQRVDLNAGELFEFMSNDRRDLITGEKIAGNNNVIKLAPYQTLWLV